MSVAAKEISNQISLAALKPSIIIVGTGPVGMKALKSIIKHGNYETIRIFGDEPWLPYNRVKLSSFLAGDIEYKDIQDEFSIPDSSNIIEHHNCEITRIDRINKLVIDEYGESYKYSHLILATGSRPHVPNVEGTHLQRVYTFRDMSDTNHLMARQVSSRSTVVVGGGLLGLEAARAMTRQHTKVTIIDHSNRLMSNQLDDGASEYLREHILSLGIHVYLGNGVKRLLGETNVSGVEMLNGKVVECDTVIFSTGIVPNFELAREAKLSIGRGIRVNNAMRTTDDDIYAIGECAEHNGKIFGLVSPGLEQAEVAVHSIFGIKTNYSGSICATQLKVVGISIFSMGQVGEEENKRELTEHVYQNSNKTIYRKIVLRQGRIVGAIAVGDFPSKSRLQEAIQKKRRIWPWQVSVFLKQGELWSPEKVKHIQQWPAGAIICNCMNVTRGECSKAIASGNRSIETLRAATNASSVCGNCQPLLMELLGDKPRLEKLNSAKSLFVISIFALAAVLAAYLLSPLSYLETVNTTFNYDILWRDNILKQVSGYSILGLSILAILISLIKRMKVIRFMDFAKWRYLHVLLGLLAIAAIFSHTGFRLGENSNLWLMMPFLALILVGSLTTLFMLYQHKMDAALAGNIRSSLIWAHIVSFWPIPALLGMHIVKTYYF